MLLRRLRQTPVWLPPAVLALLLGFQHLGRPLLWRDELATWSATSRSLGQLWGLLGNVDAVSGVYYVFLHFWTTVFGDSAVALRTPSVLAMGVAAGLTAALGKRLFGARVGLWAGLLFALTPAVLRYAQEARSYGMVTAAAVLATWQLVRVLDCKPEWSARRMRLEWLGYAGALVLTGLLHLVALSVLTSHLWLVWTRRRRAWRGFLAATVLALVLLSPLLDAGRAESGRQISWVPRPNPVAFPGMLHDLTLSWAVTVAMLVLVLVACSTRDGLRFLPVPFLPIVAVWIASQGPDSYWVERYLLFTVPLWAVLAGAGLERLPRARWTAPAGLVVVAALAVPGLRTQTGPWAHTDTDWHGATSIISAGYRPGDAMVPERGAASRYMLDLGIDYSLPAHVRPTDLFVTKSAVARDDLVPAECADPAACLNGAPRVWVISFGLDRDPVSSLPKAQQRALRAHYRIVKIDHVKGLTIGLLVQRA